MNDPLWRKVLISTLALAFFLAALANLFASTIGGVSENAVIFLNQTGLPIARIEIGERKLEGSAGTNVSDKILINVTPGKHHLKVVFRGGADVDWAAFDFKGVREIIFERLQNKIQARIEWMTKEEKQQKLSEISKIVSQAVHEVMINGDTYASVTQLSEALELVLAYLEQE